MGKTPQHVSVQPSNQPLAMTIPTLDPASGSRPIEPEAEAEAIYTLDIIVQLSGVASETVRAYQEEGLIAPPELPNPDSQRFDDETLRTLRQIEHLKACYGMSLPGIRLLLRLLQETERLEAELRAQR